MNEFIIDGEEGAIIAAYRDDNTGMINFYVTKGPSTVWVNNIPTSKVKELAEWIDTVK